MTLPYHFLLTDAYGSGGAWSPPYEGEVVGDAYRQATASNKINLYRVKATGAVLVMVKGRDGDLELTRIWEWVP